MRPVVRRRTPAGRPGKSKEPFSLGRSGNRALRWSAYVLVALAVLNGFWFVHCFGVNLLWGDDWVIMPMLSHYTDGSLQAADLWETHNEHRIVFPKLVMFGLGLLSHGNVVVNMYLIEVLLLVILAIFAVALRRQFRGGLAAWLIVPPAFLVFSLRQYENMMWGFQIGFVMVGAAALATFLCLSRIGNERYRTPFLGATMTATVAAYSSIHGLLVWPVGVGQVLMVPLTKRRKIVVVAIWTVLGVAEWGVYFPGWVKPPEHPAMGFSLRYFVMTVGGALMGNETAALSAGVVVLTLTMAAMLLVLLHRQWREQSFWLATILFSLASIAAVTVGRSGFGAGQAVSSRYATLSIPLVVAIYAVFASRSAQKPDVPGVALTGFVLVAMVLGVGVSFGEGRRTGETYRQHRGYQQFVIYTIETQPDWTIKVYPPPVDFVRRYTAMARELKYNLFADPDVCARCQLPDPSLPAISAETLCRIRHLGRMGDDKTLAIDGWAIDSPAQELAGGVTVFIDGIGRPTYYGVADSEAADRLKSDKFLLSGFRCTVAVKDLAPGKHILSLKILTHDRRAVFHTANRFEFETKSD